jgi:hypothetical protein
VIEKSATFAAKSAILPSLELDFAAKELFFRALKVGLPLGEALGRAKWTRGALDRVRATNPAFVTAFIYAKKVPVMRARTVYQREVLDNARFARDFLRQEAADGELERLNLLTREAS